MKKTVIFALAATLIALPGVMQAQTKIFIVDLQSVFKEYYKTKDADEDLKGSYSEYQKQYKQMLEDYQKMVETAGTLRDEAQNEVLSDTVRQEKGKALLQKVQEIRAEERRLKEFEVTRRRQIEEQGARMRKKIVDDITEAVDKIGKAKGANLILDTAGLGMTGTPPIMYADGLPDITKEVIAMVNASKPAAAAAAAQP